MRIRHSFKKSFSWRSNLSNDNIISAWTRSEDGYGFLPGLKTSVQNENFLVWNWVRIWRTMHPTENSQEFPPPPPGFQILTQLFSDMLSFLLFE